jgi:RNA polymerase primary sigma factor
LKRIDLGEWRSLIEHGRRNGMLSTEEIVDVVRNVELTHDVIDALRRAIEDLGVRVDQTFDLDDSGELRKPLIDAGLAPSARQRRSAPTRLGDGGDQDAVRLYMYEISQIPLLDADGERRLARQIDEGIKARAELDDRGDDIAFAERRRLRRAVESGERARQQLITSNLRLVVSIAKRFARPTMPLADAIQSGNIGLMRAVERFDHARGFKFSTYATWWIRQAISRAVAEESRNIRLPAHTVEHIHRIQRAQRELMQHLQREPTTEEIAERLGDSPDRIAELLHLSSDTTSLDQPSREDVDLTYADRIPSTTAIDPSDSIERDQLREAVRHVLEDLPEREQEVMKMRFGIDGSDGATLEEVGKAFDITRERVRQIEVRTLSRLRNMARSRSLRDYVEG